MLKTAHVARRRAVTSECCRMGLEQSSLARYSRWSSANSETKKRITRLPAFPTATTKVVRPMVPVHVLFRTRIRLLFGGSPRPAAA